MKTYFKVSVELPEGCDKELMKEYIYDAVCAMKGSYDPEGSLFWLDVDKVKVFHIKRGSKIVNETL